MLLAAVELSSRAALACDRNDDCWPHETPSDRSREGVDPILALVPTMTRTTGHARLAAVMARRWSLHDPEGYAVPGMTAANSTLFIVGDEAVGNGGCLIHEALDGDKCRLCAGAVGA